MAYTIASFYDFVRDDEFPMTDSFLVDLAKRIGKTRRELKLALMAGDLIRDGLWTYRAKENKAGA